MHMAQKLLTQQRLSDLIDVSERTLERWRVEGTGPAFVKAGRKVLYQPEDVDNWLAASRRQSTSEQREASETVIRNAQKGGGEPMIAEDLAAKVTNAAGTDDEELEAADADAS
jgi:phage terminase Nu1 subunit (DNA packaging protein)